MLTLVFGVWLALDVDGYGILDGWILIAFALWAVAGAAGIRLGLAYSEDEPPPARKVMPALRGHGRGRHRPARRDDLQARRMSYASVRPDSWNLPLLLHVLGAMVFVSAARGDRRDPRGLAALRTTGAAALRLAFRTLLIGALPSYIVMRGAAEWVASEENVDEDAAWIGIGYIVTDMGLLLLIAVTVLVGSPGAGSRAAPRSPAGSCGPPRR